MSSAPAPGIGVCPPCPVCASPYTALVRHVMTRRTKRPIPLFVCLDCKSFSNPSGYHEDEAQLKRDLEWGLSVSERNERAGADLFNRLSELGVQPSSMIDIGCGIGTVLKVAGKRGVKAIGYDVNHVATSYGREHNKVDARSEMWSPQTPNEPVDLYTCIMVLEHIDQPRPLIKDLCAATARDGAHLFISVPFVNRDRWNFIETADPLAPGSWLFDNDVHVTHFATQALIDVIRSFGLAKAEFVRAGLWHGVLASKD